MPVLTLDVGGPDEMNVECQRGGHAAPRKVGNRAYSGSGSEFSQIRAELMVVPAVLAPLPSAQVATISTLFALGARVNCSGDVFNRAGTIVCSGTITDELHTTADRWTVNLTLFEVGSASGYSPVISQFLLTSVDSPDSSDPTVFVSTPDGSYSGDSSTGTTLLSGTTVTTGGSLNPTTPDISWLSVPLNAGVAYGRPYVRLEAAMSGVYSGTTVWAVMDMMAKIYQVRDDGMGGFDIIAGPFSTNYAGVGLGGSVDILTSTSTIVLSIQTGDRLLVELYPRLQLQPATADNGQRQVIAKGTIPGPRPMPILGIAGLLTSYP